MFRFFALMLLPALPGIFAPTGSSGQLREISLEVGGSSIRPPSGVEGDAASFLVAGIRAQSFDFVGTGFMGAVQAGRSMSQGSGGDFLSGTLEGSYWHSLAGGWSGGLEVRGFAFEVTDPFAYRALAVEGGPSIRFSGSHFSATLDGVVGSGWSRTELLPYADEPAVTMDEDLWRYGLSGEFLAGTRIVMAGLAAGVHESPGGTYRSLGGRLLLKGSGPVVEFTLDAWHTPLGNETTGGVALVVPLDGWSLRGFLGKSEPDPLTLAEPGGGSGGLMVGRRLWGRDPLPPARAPLHEVLDSAPGASRVRIHVRPPRETEEVQVLGDFTLWEPVSMERDGDRWVVEMRISEGVHHFGFLADGEWYVPEEAPDTVSDEWGRTNATLVIER
ncbi:MAG: glycogen-binding domain-containing protein [Longimicrobiales bacterium]